VSPKKKVFSFHWISVFVQFFFEFVEVILERVCADRKRALLSHPNSSQFVFASLDKLVKRRTTGSATPVRFPGWRHFFYFFDLIFLYLFE
jgi:hypothetical protein